jgi:hypothetical protein
VEGGVTVEPAGYRLSGVNAQIGDITARVDGRVGLLPDLAGTSVTLIAEGPDISVPASLAGFAGMPAEPFRVEGRFRMGREGLELDGVQARVGEAWVNLTGRVASTPNRVGTRLRVEAAGPDASTFGPILGSAALPPEPYSVSGGIQFEPEGYALNDVVAELGWVRAEIDGIVVPSGDLIGTDVRFTIAAPRLSTVGDIVTSAGIAKLPPLPAEPFSVAGGVGVDDAGYELRDLHLTLGMAKADVTGRIGLLPHVRGSDLTVVSDGPNASLFTAITGVTVPVAPFRINGRMERLDEGFRFHSVWVQLGDYQAQANGLLGEPPRLIGTNIDVEARGPSLVLISELFGTPELPDQPFDVVGHFDGNPRRFKLDRFTAVLGSSDLSGAFRLDLEGRRPELSGEFRSSKLDLRDLFPQREDVDDSEEETPEVAAKGELVITDEPFDLGVLNAADGTLTVSIDEVVMPHSRLQGIRVGARLHNGRLAVDPVSGTGTYGAVLTGNLVLEPVGNDYRLATHMTLDQARIDLSTIEDDPSQWPVFDFNLDLDATGGSPHEMAGTANGRFSVIVGPGVIGESVINILTADILVKLLDALNPFTSKNPASMLKCAVMVVDIADGVATVGPLAIQTDTLTILADGRIDLSTEKMSLDWITKPRKGFGVSASLITNPYIRIGGTLSNPSLEMKPIQAAASTGLAVATGGLSLLGQGLLDRITAEQKVCEQALKRAAKQKEKKERRKAGG